MEEIRQLAAERLAAETLLVALLSRFDDHDASTRATINDAFDHATRFLEDRTFDASKSAGPEELAHSLRVIEELRVATLVPERIETREFFGGLAFLRLGLRRESDTLRARR